ncbi:hypothetical protein [Microbacterium sp. 69-7]|uniref:hypothetical protein n=1 Tax=Microbacterium sp. 69-7 TaxID=1895784 RepID=UPI00258B0D01|nr:hypothetical protein [Microbacterium sp. 69-7]
MTDYRKWVQDAQPVEARFAQGSGVFMTGRVIAYADTPTVIIETTDGQRASWVASLCTPITPVEEEEATWIFKSEN